MDLNIDYDWIINDIFKSENVTRRQKEYDSYVIDSGDQRDYVIARLKQLFPKSWQSMRVSDVAVMRKIYTKISQAYKKAPTRMFPYSQEDYEQLYSNGQFNRIFAEADRDYNRQKYLLLWVNQADDQNIYLNSIKGFQSHVIVDATTGKLKLVALVYEIDKEKSEVALWTDEQHSKFKVNRTHDKITIERVAIDDNESGINPLGIIPFVFVSSRSGAQLPFMNNLYLQSIDCNIILSDLHTAGALQGYGQMVFKKPEGIKIENMHTGMTTALEIPLVEGALVQADVSYINANPDLAGLERIAYKYMQSIYNDNGITTNVMNDSANAFSSGFERVVAEADVQSLISCNQNIYNEIEKQVFNIINLYAGITEQGDLSVIYPKPTVLISDKETLENIKTRLDLGLITKAEALMILNPNLKNEEAEERLALIEQEKINNVGVFFGNQSVSE